jgi:hypothetical protein
MNISRIYVKKIIIIGIVEMTVWDEEGGVMKCSCHEQGRYTAIRNRATIRPSTRHAATQRDPRHLCPPIRPPFKCVSGEKSSGVKYYSGNKNGLRPEIPGKSVNAERVTPEPSTGIKDWINY